MHGKVHQRPKPSDQRITLIFQIEFEPLDGNIVTHPEGREFLLVGAAEEYLS